MLTYLPSTKIRVEFEIEPSMVSGTFKVLDETEQEIFSKNLSAGELSATSYSPIIDVATNDIGTETKGVRAAQLWLMDGDGIETLQQVRYYLMKPTRLVKGENSLLTFSEALLLVPDIAKLEGWHLSDDTLRVAALIEAYDNLKQFPLRGEDYENLDATQLTLDQISALDTTMLKAFQKAQLLQTDFLLGGEPAKSLRDSGLISKSVGESTSFFRTTKALNYGIADRAYAQISRYVKRAVRLVNA